MAHLPTLPRRSGKRDLATQSNRHVTTIDLDRAAAKTEENADTLVVRSATAVDATAIYALISKNLVAGHLLARPLGEVELHIPRFIVAAESLRVIGCGELARLSTNVAEVRSLVVTSERRGEGIGTCLLTALIAEAIARRVPRICAFTHNPRPFVQVGFSIAPHPWVPDKIATDCQTCDLFRRCDRYAVVLDTKPTCGGTP